MRGTKRSPGLHRRRARAAERLGSGGGSGWSSKSDMGLGGNEGGAYRGSIGGPSGSGETSEVASGRRRSRAAGDGEDGVGGDAGLPALRSSMERSGASRRSLWSLWWGGTTVVATTATSGGDGGSRSRE